MHCILLAFVKVHNRLHPIVNQVKTKDPAHIQVIERFKVGGIIDDLSVVGSSDSRLLRALQ